MHASGHDRRHLAAGLAPRRGGAWHVYREQTLMWELWWQANRATVPSTGPLHHRHNTDEGETNEQPSGHR